MIRKIINVDYLDLLILDEADEMLSGTFKDNIQNIIQRCSNETNICVFSATLPDSILQLTDKFMNDPYKIIVKKEELSLECIQQYYIALENDNDKYNTLKQLFEFLTITQCIVFVNGVNRVTDLFDAFSKEGFTVCCMHSNMSKDDERHWKNLDEVILDYYYI